MRRNLRYKRANITVFHLDFKKFYSHLNNEQGKGYGPNKSLITLEFASCSLIFTIYKCPVRI